jgi:hypothetical protein
MALNDTGKKKSISIIHIPKHLIGIGKVKVLIG